MVHALSATGTTDLSAARRKQRRGALQDAMLHQTTAVSYLLLSTVLIVGYTRLLHWAGTALALSQIPNSSEIFLLGVAAVPVAIAAASTATRRYGLASACNLIAALLFGCYSLAALCCFLYGMAVESPVGILAQIENVISAVLAEFLFVGAAVATFRASRALQSIDGSTSYQMLSREGSRKRQFQQDDATGATPELK